MTDIRNAGTQREVLLTTVPAATAAGLVREVLLATPTALIVGGLVREVLVPGTVTPQQYAVSVIT
jgi:hypothetical protein